MREQTNGPVLVFGGCYSNLEATRTMLGIVDRLGFEPDNVICTGDVVAYCSDPQATVDLIRGSGIRVIMGNCEEALAAGSDNCGCGFEEGSACDRLSSQWYKFTAAHLDEGARKWMAGLPRQLEIELDGYRLAVIHGGARQINRFIFESSPLSVKQEEIAWLGCDGVIAGHCGIPFTQRIGEYFWHNSGALGMPPNDGTARTWYSILHPHAGGIMIEPLPLLYAADEAMAKMLACGLTGGYEKTLVSGIWPSTESLPAAERARTAMAIEPQPMFWSRRAEPLRRVSA